MYLTPSSTNFSNTKLGYKIGQDPLKKELIWNVTKMVKMTD
jgi:hypothetical protein